MSRRDVTVGSRDSRSAPSAPGRTDLITELDGRLGLSRRSLLARGAAGGMALGLGGLLAACGGDDNGGSTTAAPQTAGGFKPSPGSDIPKTEVKFAMWPYGDSMLGTIAMEQGWFEEVGITLPLGKKVLALDQANNQLANGQLDMAIDYLPTTISIYARSPQIKHFMTVDTWVGNYFLASPKSGAKTWTDFVNEGQSPDEAYKSTIGQMKGKRVVITDDPGPRPFFTTMMKLGGLTTKDFGSFEILSDPRVVQLGKSGRADFAMPGGAAQNLELVDIGFTRIAGVKDLIEGLPVGDERAVNGIGFAGISTNEDYMAGNRETIMRVMSVYYRIIDFLEADPAKALAFELPNLKAAAGVDVTLEGFQKLWEGENFYVPWNFEKQVQLEVDTKSRQYYKTVLTPQIEAAKKGGIIPKGTDVTPDDLSVASGFYKDMVSLKKQYDDLKGGSDAPTGALADKAAVQYKNRNYLDAFRMLSAAAQA